MRAARATTTLLALVLLGGCHRSAGQRGPARPMPEAVRFASTVPGSFLRRPLDDWPLVHVGVESRYLSSFDRRGGNADGFYGTHSTLYRLPSGEHVIFDVLGPAVLNTLWFTGPREGGEGLDLGRLRFYFDDEQAPRIVTEAGEMFGGKRPPFVAPLVADNRVSTGGFVSWVPLPFARRLIVTTARKPAFYIAQYDQLPRDTPLTSWQVGQRLTAERRVMQRAGEGLRPRADLQRVPLHHRRQGAGTIELIEFEPTTSPDERTLQRARIRLRWDDQRAWSVDVPLGMFFGSGLGEAEVRALAFSMARGRYRNRFPMPFWRGFEIEITGIEGQLRLVVGPPRFSAQRAGHFHARYREAWPTVRGEDFQWLRFEGAGKLVGTVLTIKPSSPQNKRWWEGDLRSYVDGRQTPGLHGTGHEDDHLGGWSNTFFSRPFTLPLHGEPVARIVERQGPQYNAEITLYRLWPGITFLRSIRHGVEHGNENQVASRYAGVAFFYALAEGPLLEAVDRLVLADAAARERHRMRLAGEARRYPLRSAFEGRAYRRPVAGEVWAHRGRIAFRLAARRDNQGCFLRRTYDQRAGRQRATIAVDGADVGDWYTVEHNVTLRWAERDYFLPAAVTQGKAVLEIAITPRGDAPPWTAAQYRLFCVRGARRVRRVTSWNSRPGGIVSLLPNGPQSLRHRR